MWAIFVGLCIVSISAGYSQGPITGWTIFGTGLIIMGLIEKMEK